MEAVVDRYQRDSRVLVPQLGRPSQNPSLNDQVLPYQRNFYNQNNSLASPAEEANRKSSKVHQNANAIRQYSRVEKGKVLEGRHSAAVAQLHQNDLHNMDLSGDLMGIEAQNGLSNGQEVTRPDRSKSYIKQQLSIQSKLSNIQNASAQSSSFGKPLNGQDSELTTSFDPMKDRHMWTMWRTAVNGRIVDEVRQLERLKSEGSYSSPTDGSDQANGGVYGKALVTPPLKRFIKLDEESRAIADLLQQRGQGGLAPPQFVYYGLPRVSVAPARRTSDVP